MRLFDDSLTTYILYFYRAPSDCYQYLTGISGTLKSFNYPTVMLSAIQYTACVRQEYGYCGIAWSAAATTSPDPFDLDDTETTDGLALGGTATASDAYIIIPGSLYTTYGGNALVDESATTDDNQDINNGVIEATGVPNRLTVTSHTATANGAANGFSLVYNQLPCAYARHATSMLAPA